jgi:superfamily I DNA/RNA helicase
MTNQGLKEQPSPLEQARQYAYAVKNVLERDPTLVLSEGQHRGALVLPYGYGVVLTNITRKALNQTDLPQVLDERLVICQDEMVESVDAELFQKRLWNMFMVAFPCLLTMPQIDRIRWHLYPEIRINPEQSPLLVDDQETSPKVAIPDLIRVMDVQQEQLARSLGEGHRVIHGVTGSGKTMILGYRVTQLAEVLSKPVLVLCFNVTLASRLRRMVDDEHLKSKVVVRNFHAWCSDQLTLYHVPKPKGGEGFFDRLVEQVIEGVERGQIPRAQYGAVLIDEGHDFQPEWFKLIVQMVDIETNSLLVLCDDAQSINNKERRRDWSWASVGVHARGRTTILRLNYRNTEEVLAVAYEFAKDILVPKEAEDDGIPLVRPESAGRHGPVPELVQLPNLKSEVNFIADRLRAHHERGVAWNKMAVVYRAYFIGREIARGLRAAGIPVEWLNEDKWRRHFDPTQDSVKIVTMHSSKGLEFPIVAIPGLGLMPREPDDAREEARLLYVAMTRAMDELLLTCDRQSEFVAKLAKARARLAA